MIKAIPSPVAPAPPRTYRICARCIMDTSDPDITFDDRGACRHCLRFETEHRPGWDAKKQPGRLDAFIERVRADGRGRAYDAIIGVSGGVDSTFCAYRVKQLGLRPLAVHLDNGWNSELAVGNIEQTLKRCGIDLVTHVLNWDEFRDLQLSFLKASTPDCEIPTDHAILAVLYRTAAREGVRYILSGHNSATEGGGVPAWSQGHGDWKYIRGIHERFGTVPLRDYPHYGLLRFATYRLLRGIRFVQILDYLEYDKQEAIRTIEEQLGWRPYSTKHGESIYTRFYQSYILRRKFGFDKKRLHLSSLIWSGQLTREEALARMDREDYSEAELEEEKTFVIKKLGIAPEEFDAIMKAEPKRFEDYPSYKRSWLFRNPAVLAAYRGLIAR